MRETVYELEAVADVRRFAVAVEVTVEVAPRGGGRVWDLRPDLTCSCGADMCPHKMAVLSRLASESTLPAA